MSTKYEVCDFYMLRTPLLPIDFYKKICFPNSDELKDGIESILNAEEIKEVIRIGSTSLYNSLYLMNDKVNSSLRFRSMQKKLI